MFSVLLNIQMVICVLLIIVVLIQNKSVSLNLTSMSGSAGPTTKRWPEKVLHNATIVISTIFILNSVILFILW